jgi:exopolysaccharide production protein ExoZ
MEILNPSPISKGSRLQSVDELKGFAMVLVLLYHAGGVLKWDNWLHGEVGVDIFLMISAFTLVLTARTLPVKEFLKRRLLRIFPSYWVAVAFFVILDDRLFGSNYSAASIVLHLTGLHGFSSGVYFSDICDSFWFISLILAMYVVFLFVRSRLADLSYVVGFGLLLTVATCSAYIAAAHAGGLIQLAVRIPSFFIGLVAGQLWTSPVSTLRPSGILVAGLVAITYLGWFKGIITFYAVAALGMTAAFLLLARYLGKAPEGKMALAGFSFIGVYSYEIFLFHQPLMRDYNYYVYRVWLGIEPTDGELALGILVSLLVTLLISVGLHKSVAAMFSSFRKEAPVPVPKALA